MRWLVGALVAGLVLYGCVWAITHGLHIAINPPGSGGG